MIGYARIFSGSCSNKLEEGLFESFSGWNVINQYVKNNELPNSSISVKEDSFISINLHLTLLRVLRRVILLSSNKGQWRKSEKLIRYSYHNNKED